MRITQSLLDGALKSVEEIETGDFKRGQLEALKWVKQILGDEGNDNG